MDAATLLAKIAHAEDQIAYMKRMQDPDFVAMWERSRDSLTRIARKRGLVL